MKRSYSKLTIDHVHALVALVGGALNDGGVKQTERSFVFDPKPEAGSPQYDIHLVNYRPLGAFVAGNSPLTLYPDSTLQVSKVLAYCSEHSIKVFTQGGNTGLVGSSVPDTTGDGIVLSLRKMDRILSEIGPEHATVSVEAGVIVDVLNTEAKKSGLFCSIKHGGTGSATIGGSAATNAGGANAVKYGVTRDQVVGLTAVTATGKILHLGGTLKDTSSPIDLKHVFIGSSGLLGVITEVEIALHPLPSSWQTALIGCDSYAEAYALLANMQKAFSGRLEAFEYMNGRIFQMSVDITQDAGSVLNELQGKAVVLLVEVSSGKTDDAALQDELFAQLEQFSAVLIAMDQAQRDLFWLIREHCNPASKQFSGNRGVYFDTCVPVSRVGDSILGNERILRTLFPDEMERGAIVLLEFGHCADGNIHTHVVQPLSHQDEHFDLRDRATQIEKALLSFNVGELGGNPAAEHNIGIKTHRLQFTQPEQIELVSALKDVFDPNGIMNPGRGLP